jgi:iron(III) transport system ATP-binding protein
MTVREDVPAAVELRGVSKRFGRTVALDDVTLEVGAGELVALVGPSGCGKSTLLLMAAGMLAPDTGTVSVAGEVVAGAGRWTPPERRGVGIVFQDTALFPHLRVDQNVGFGLGRDPGRAGRVAELLELVDLAGLGSRFPHELSGGQQQRVALARALAPRPRVVLFDEAFGNLDGDLRASLRAQTVAALHDAGAAGVFVTHDRDEALSTGERVVVMHDGRVEQVASPAEAFHQPANRFVATLLGEADFLPGQQHGDQASTELGTVECVPGVTGAVDVMLRPHEVGFVVEGHGAARVVRREFRGSHHVYTLRLASGVTVRSLQPHVVDLPVGTTVSPVAVGDHPLRSFGANAAAAPLAAP